VMMQIVAMKKLYKFNLERIKLQGIGSSFSKIELDKLEKEFKASISRLILTTMTCCNVFCGMVMGNVYLNVQSANLSFTNDLLNGNPEKYAINPWASLGFLAISSVYMTLMVLSWISPDENDQSRFGKFSNKISEISLKTTWTFIGKRLFPLIEEVTNKAVVDHKVELSRNSTTGIHASASTDFLTSTPKSPLLQDSTEDLK
jgi:hypothetical protein